MPTYMDQFVVMELEKEIQSKALPSICAYRGQRIYKVGQTEMV